MAYEEKSTKINHIAEKRLNYRGTMRKDAHWETRESVSQLSSSRYLSDNTITKLEDSPFRNLSHLFELNLAHNNISSLSLPAFAGLTKLRYLSLQSNKLATIPSASLEPLASLESLHLDNNQLTDVPVGSLKSLRRLQKLWINGNQLQDIPSDALAQLPDLEALDLGENKIPAVPDFAFLNMTKLVILMLYRNEITHICPHGLDGLESLKVLEIHGNKLTELPAAISSLPTLREFVFSDNVISELSDYAFRKNPKLTLLEMGGNPIVKVGSATFAHLPSLKKLRVSEARQMEIFPDLTGTNALELLTLDRASIQHVPSDLCDTLPLLRRLILRSNKIEAVPDLRGCKELRQIDLGYNLIGSLSGSFFLQQTKLLDLYLGHNLIRFITEDAFYGLDNLQVLDLMHNNIEEIHESAFVNLTSLVDLNLGENKFSVLPTNGLQNLRQLKTFNNKNLREFPIPELFPKVHSLALSYAYHCCLFRPLARRLPLPNTLKETIVWLSREDVDMEVWSTNITDVWPGYENFSSKFEEFAGQLWKAFGRDYAIPDNLAQFAEEHFRDYKVSRGPNVDRTGIDKQPVQCLPEPGPFMPCEDLFGWWSLRCGVWVVFLLAMLGNGVVVVVLLFGRSKIDVPRFLVCNLAMADFFMGIYLGILAVVDASTLGEFRVYAIQWQMSAGCQIAGFLGVLSSELSVYTLAVITLERNYAIAHAMHLNKRLSLRHAGYIMGGGWIFALLMAILPLFGISDYRKFAVCLPFETEDPWSMSYVVFLILINGVAFLTLMGCYLKMYWVIRGSQAWNSNDSRIAKRMALLVITDFICWAPIAFFSLTAVFGADLISLEEAKVFTIFVLPLNSCANPFLYAIFTKQFKKDCVLICKRIEESRVTRGIGRCRHSSNFSNRHTPANTNSAGERKSGNAPNIYEGQPVCQCGTYLKQPFNRKYLELAQPPETGWRTLAKRYLLFQFAKREGGNFTVKSAAQNRTRTETLQKTNSSISSDNFSSRSDSWRQGNFPLRLLERGPRRNSWTGSTQKSSQDSSNSCSRQDSGSTSTSRLSRSSVSSDASSSRPGSIVRERAATSYRKGGPNGDVPNRFMRGVTLSNVRDKPKLCRQGAVMEEASLAQRIPNYRGGPTETAILRKTMPPTVTLPKKGVCTTCGRRETMPNLRFKSKELEDKFNCFYSKLVETSHEESSEAKDEHALSTDRSTTDEHKTDSGKETVDTSLSEQPSEDFDSVQSPLSKEFPTSVLSENAPRCDDANSQPGPSSNYYNEFVASTPRTQECKHSPSVQVSSDGISKSKSRSMSNLGFDFKLFSRQRKAISDNSLKKISLKNLPQFLRTLSSQSTQNTSQKSSMCYQNHSGQLAPYSRPIPYCRSEATIVNRSPDSSRTHVWSPQGGSLTQMAYSNDDMSSGADDADIDEEEDDENGKSKVLIKRKAYYSEIRTKGEGHQESALCSTASDDAPLIDKSMIQQQP